MTLLGFTTGVLPGTFELKGSLPAPGGSVTPLATRLGGTTGARALELGMGLVAVGIGKGVVVVVGGAPVGFRPLGTLGAPLTRLMGGTADCTCGAPVHTRQTPQRKHHTESYER